jgi:hypothetical protein
VNIEATHKNEHDSGCDNSSSTRFPCGRGSVIAIAALIVGITAILDGCTQGDRTTSRVSCPGSPIERIAEPHMAVDGVGLDISVSTESALRRASYEDAALSSVSQAASEKAAIRIVAFGASGVGAKIMFEGSFAPASDEDVYNLAAQNRALCWAKQAIAQALAKRTSPRDAGTDLAGATAALITDARSLLAHGGSASVTVFTDGCQAPSLSGPNRDLTDLCGVLASGESPAQIFRSHASEFSLGDAHGVTIAMRGVGVGRNQNAASSTFARRLVIFWTKVCRMAHARACEIGSAVS